MRVFDSYEFNIADNVKFKDSAKYIDTMLKDLNLEFKNVMFTYCSVDENIIKKILNKYPSLEKYLYNDDPDHRSFGYKFSSFTSNWQNGEIYAQKEDYDSLFEIVSKCPRSININGSLVLNQIDWYGEGVKETVIDKNLEKGKPSSFIMGSMTNNQIILERNYDDGNKYVRVYVVIDATTNGDPRDTSDIIKKVEQYLGKPIAKWRKCKDFDIVDKEISKKRDKCLEILSKKITEFCKCESGTNKCELNYDEFIPNIANKKKIKEAFKGTSFAIGNNKGLLPGMNRVFAIDKNNHLYEILFDRTQSCPKSFYWYIYIEGYNFLFNLGQNQMYVSSEEDAKEKLLKIAKFCEKLVQDNEQLLFESYGATPKWYSYVKD